MHHALCIKNYALCIKHHASCIMNYALSIKHYELFIPLHDRQFDAERGAFTQF